MDELRHLWREHLAKLGFVRIDSHADEVDGSEDVLGLEC